MQPEETPVIADDMIATLAPRRFPFWGWLDLALFFGLFVAMVALIIILLLITQTIWPSLKTNQVPLFLPSQLGLYVAIYVPLAVIFRFRYNKPVFSSLGWQNTLPAKSLALFGLGGLVLSPALALLASSLHTPPIDMDVLVKLQGHPIILSLFGITAVTLAPLFEESLFRGFLQPLLSRSLGVLGGILITALLFGGLHAIQYKFVWQYVAAISVVGGVLGVVRYRTGSLIPSTVMHACFNLIASTEIFFHHPK